MGDYYESGISTVDDDFATVETEENGCDCAGEVVIVMLLINSDSDLFGGEANWGLIRGWETAKLDNGNFSLYICCS